MDWKPKIPMDAKYVEHLKSRSEHNYKVCSLCLKEFKYHNCVYLIKSSLKQGYKWSVHKKCWEKFLIKQNKFFGRAGV